MRRIPAPSGTPGETANFATGLLGPVYGGRAIAAGSGRAAEAVFSKPGAQPASASAERRNGEFHGLCPHSAPIFPQSRAAATEITY